MAKMLLKTNKKKRFWITSGFEPTKEIVDHRIIIRRVVQKMHHFYNFTPNFDKGSLNVCGVSYFKTTYVIVPSFIIYQEMSTHFSEGYLKKEVRLNFAGKFRVNSTVECVANSWSSWCIYFP